MRSIIEEMYNGTLHPFGEVNLKENADIADKLIEKEHEIMEKFPECMDIFKRYMEDSNNYEHKLAYRQFLNGIRVGAQLMLEMIYTTE